VQLPRSRRTLWSPGVTTAMRGIRTMRRVRGENSQTGRRWRRQTGVLRFAQDDKREDSNGAAFTLPTD
jgi:hypothetical protein